MDKMYFFIFILIFFALIIGIVIGWIIFKRKYSSDKEAQYNPYSNHPVKIPYVPDSKKTSIEITPGIEIFQYKRFSEKIEPSKSIDLPKETHRYFEPIVHLIPTSALALDGASKWVLKFSPEVTQGLMDGIYHLQSSSEGIQAVARNAQGRIVEHGKLVQAGISPVAGVAIGWQILAIITAQKYLSLINKRLANIESAISEVKEMIDSIQWSAIQGAYKYITDKFNKLKNTPLTKEEMQVLFNQIEDSIKKSEGIFFYFKDRVNNIINDILNRELDQRKYFFPKITLKENFNFIRQKISEYIKYHSLCFSVYQLKMCAHYLIACLPVVNKEGCLSDIEKLKDDLLTDIREFNSEVNKINKKIETLYGRWSSYKTDIEKQKQLKSELYKLISDVNKKLEFINQDCQEIEKNIKYQIEKSKEPQYLEIELENNTINRVAILEVKRLN